MTAKKVKKKKKSVKTTSAVKKYKEIINDLEQRLTESNDKNLRLLAEFENFKNRSQLEKNKLRKYEGIDAFRSMLSILDDFDRTLKLPELKKNKSLDEGLNMIVEKVISIFNDVGIVSYDSMGKKFDTELHEALMTKKSKKESNTIIEEFEKGYKYHDKVIRHAKVVVSE